MNQKNLTVPQSFTQEDLDTLQLEAGEALILLNASGEVISVSDEAACLLKVAPDALMGRTLMSALDIRKPEDVRLVEELFFARPRWRAAYARLWPLWFSSV